jgi:hypothetical protein
MKTFNFQGGSVPDQPSGPEGHGPAVPETATSQPEPSRAGWVRPSKLRRLRRIWPVAAVGGGLVLLLKSSREFCCEIADAAIAAGGGKFLVNLLFDVAELMVSLLII